jgi:hypothetical protein
MAGKLMLHCGGEEISYENLKKIEAPERTKTYGPVPHHDLVDLVNNRVEKEFPGSLIEWQYGIDKGGARFFGVGTLTLDKEDIGLAVGLANSHDKSGKVQYALGSQVFVCDNTSFLGDSMVVMHKHSPSAWDSMVNGIYRSMVTAERTWDEMSTEMLGLRDISISDERGAEIIGLAQYKEHRVLTDTQANRARDAWGSTEYPEFEERNLWSLYNAMTEGGKHGRCHGAVGRYTGIHEFFHSSGKIAELA